MEFTSQERFGFQAIAGPNENRFRAGRKGGFEVAKRVADNRDAIELDIEVRSDLSIQTGLGLATVATVVRTMRANDNVIDSPAGSFNQRAKLRMHRL